jgi:hypothetical protein
MAEDRVGTYLGALLKVVPLYGLILAIAYQIGRFQVYGIEFFTTLSVSDHIAMVIGLAPYTIFCALIGIAIGQRENRSIIDLEAKGDPRLPMAIKKANRGYVLNSAVLLIFVADTWAMVIALVLVLVWKRKCLVIVALFLPNGTNLSRRVEHLVDVLPTFVLLSFAMGNLIASIHVHGVPKTQWEVCVQERACEQVDIFAVLNDGSIFRHGNTVNYMTGDGELKISRTIEYHRAPIFQLLGKVGDLFEFKSLQNLPDQYLHGIEEYVPVAKAGSMDQKK